MQQQITGYFKSEDLLSVMEDKLGVKSFVDQVIGNASVMSQIIMSLKIINVHSGASPEIIDLTITRVNFNKVTLTGTLSMVYQLKLYWGCSLSSTQNKTETIWNFDINGLDNSINFRSAQESERSTYEEF